MVSKTDKETHKTLAFMKELITEKKKNTSKKVVINAIKNTNMVLNERIKGVK